MPTQYTGDWGGCVEVRGLMGIRPPCLARRDIRAEYRIPGSQACRRGVGWTRVKLSGHRGDPSSE